MTFRETENKFIQDLKHLYDKEEAKALAIVSFAHVCKLTPGQILIDRQKELSTIDENAILFIIDELKTGKPLQYVLEEAEFYGLKLKVNASVLIPRPETEELVDWILFEIKNKKLKVSSILDIGTGSGCIPIALKKALNYAAITAIDISAEALEIARQNAILNKTKISFIQADMLNFIHAEHESKYSLIVSNPPYITDKEKEAMHLNVIQYEPHLALFVGDRSPLIFYEKISDFALTHLEENGLLFFEINETLGEETVSMLYNKGFNNVSLRKDLQGKNRMIKAARNYDRG